MVLMQYFFATLLILMGGCLPKSPPATLLQHTQIETTLSVQDSTGDWSSASSELEAEFHRTFRAFGEESGTQQATVQLQLGAHYFSQLQGQHRWIVSGSIAVVLGDLTEPEVTVKQDLEVPVFLDHPHQGSDDALLASLPLLKRHVQNLIATATERRPSDN